MQDNIFFNILFCPWLSILSSKKCNKMQKTMKFFRRKEKKPDPTLLEIFALEVERKAQEKAARLMKSSLSGSELLLSALTENGDELLLSGGRRRITDTSPKGFASKYEEVVWVYICVNARARNIANVPLIVVDPATQEKIEHPFQQVLERPNPCASQSDLLERTMVSLDTSGKTLWELRRNAKGDIIEMYALDGWRVEVTPDKSATSRANDNIVNFKYTIEKEKENLTGKAEVIVFEPSDVVYFRYFNPLKSYDGLSPISSARLQIQADLYAIAWNKTFFEEETEPRGVLQTEQPLLEDEASWVREQFEKKHKARPHRIAVLPKGIKYLNTTISHTDMDFLNQQRNTRNLIAGIYGVPLPVMGFYESETTSGRSAGIEQYMGRFWTQTLIPVMRKIISALNLTLGQQFNPPINFAFDLDAVEALQGNQKEMAATAKLMVGTGLSWNEIRQKAYGEPPIPGMDWIPVPVNLAPAEEAPVEMSFGQPVMTKKKLLTATRFNNGKNLLPSKL